MPSNTNYIKKITTKKDVIHHKGNKHVKSSGHNQHHDLEKAHKENKLTVKHKTHDVENGGKKLEHFEDNHHQSHKKSNVASQHGAKHKQAAKDKKTHYNKGFREQYHKDEHKKHDSFFSNDHKAGEYHVYGGKNHKYNDNHYNKNGHGKYTSGKHSEHYGKNGKKLDKYKYPVKKVYQRSASNPKYTKHEKWAKKNLATKKQHPHLIH